MGIGNWSRELLSIVFVWALVGMQPQGAFAAKAQGKNSAPAKGVAAAAAPKWKGEVPEIARESKNWTTLLDAMMAAKLPYGALASASRMLVFFQDLPTKEAAYRAVIGLIDAGYPQSAKGTFIAGDIEPEGDYGFANSYNLYKYILNEEKGMDRWAAQYYEKIDHVGFAKYRFYLAVRAYAKGDLSAAEDHLREVLSKDTGEGSGALAAKAARMLARIQFERKEFTKALDIYTSFLLRMNPALPSDWLEAGWTLYHLKKFPEALGILYNLESRAAGPLVQLEKYTLRALIYRESCDVASAEALIASFDREFGTILGAIKRGEPFSRYPRLAQIDVPGAAKFHAVSETLAGLNKERAQALARLPEELRPLASYLYDSEAKMLESRVRAEREPAVDASARQLVQISENLRFLRFDVAREGFNPDVVFKTATSKTDPVVKPISGFEVRWPQRGDFWRNERLKFRGGALKRCGE